MNAHKVPGMLEAHVRKIEEAIHAAEHSTGMGLHDGKAVIDSSILHRLLQAASQPVSAELTELKQTAWRNFNVMQFVMNYLLEHYEDKFDVTHTEHEGDEGEAAAQNIIDCIERIATSGQAGQSEKASVNATSNQIAAKMPDGSTAANVYEAFECGRRAASQPAPANVPSGYVLAPYPITDELARTETKYKGAPLPTSIVIEVYHSIVRQLVAAPVQAGGEDARDAASLLAVLREVREALQFANDSPGGPINDTIWMMHRPETLFDFIDAAIAARKESGNG